MQQKIESTLTTVLNMALCQDVLPQLLATLSTSLQPFKASPHVLPAAVAIPGNLSTLVRWSEVGLLQALPPPSVMTQFINQAMTGLVGAQDLVTTSLPRTQLPLGQLGTLSLALPELRLRGLETMENVSVLALATEAHSLHTSLQQRTMDLGASLRVGMAPANTTIAGPALSLCCLYRDRVPRRHPAQPCESAEGHGARPAGAVASARGDCDIDVGPRRPCTFRQRCDQARRARACTRHASASLPSLSSRHGSLVCHSSSGNYGT